MSRAKLPVYVREVPPLTAREMDVLALMQRKLPPAEIAKLLRIKHQVAKNYMHRVREKIGWADSSGRAGAGL